LQASATPRHGATRSGLGGSHAQACATCDISKQAVGGGAGDFGNACPDAPVNI